MRETADILITNGLIFDGTGAPSFKGNLAICGDTISSVRRKSISAGKNTKILDAAGHAVAPGFIDAHAHSEFVLLADPSAEGKMWQGIATEVNGNCGISAAPLTGAAAVQREADLSELGIRERWSTFQQYFLILEKRRPCLNFATLAGHGNIRASVMGYRKDSPDPNEMDRMKELLLRMISEGARGISTGLIYPPGIYAETPELIELCRAMKAFGKKRPGIYTSHMRSEGDRVIESVEELITIGRKSGVPVHISHIKTSGQRNWPKVSRIIGILQEACKSGLALTADRYPYIAGSTDLDSILPAWVYEGGTAKELERLNHAPARDRIREEIISTYTDRAEWEHVLISSVASEKNKWMEGKSIAQIARVRNLEEVDFLLEILADERARAGAIFMSMSEENLEKFLSLPYVMIGTDSSARSASGPTRTGKPHPRGFGSYPRFFGRYVREKALMSLTEAIYRTTMLPAVTFGLSRRGILKRGAFADIVVFDHERILDRSTFESPFLRSKGLHSLIVNGMPVILEGVPTGARPGRILRETS
jgi:N-acyl-D-amino-acid deacylase